MKIVRLEAENVKKLRAVQIEPDGNVVVIGGRNGAGKTSVLDSIAYALGGKTLCPSRPVRDGETGARAKVDLGDLVVERTWTENGSYLKVRTADGYDAPSPQAVLDKLVGRLSFDPLAFVDMTPREQVETLRELVGLDFGELDARRERLYKERTEVGRDLKRMQGTLSFKVQDPDAPTEPISVTALMDQLREAREHNAQFDLMERQAERLRESANGFRARIDAIDEEIAKLQKEREQLWTYAEDMDLELGRVEDDLDAFEAEDTGAIDDRIRAAEGLNARYRAAQERLALDTEIAGAQEEYEKLTAAIGALDDEKRQALAAASFPVEGLSFDAEQVFLNGFPFNQASSAEQLRVSVAMGLAANPQLRVLLIRDGSLLDEDNLGLVAQLAADADAQVWIERVGSGPEVSVLIEDGEVVA